MNITSKLQSEMFCLYAQWADCLQRQGDRIGTDVFPTLQGTGIQIFSGHITRRKLQVCLKLAIDKERFAYIVYRWLTNKGSRPIYIG